MADMTREEVDAKIATNEARSDALVAAILAKMDMLIARMDDMDRRMRDLVASFADLKKTVILTGISSVLAIMFGMAGFNAALLSNMTGAFESGKDTGQWQSDMRKQNEENRKQSDENRRWLEETKKQSADAHREWTEQAEKTDMLLAETGKQLKEQVQKTDRQLLEMQKQREQTQLLLEAIKQERASGRR
jgi:flagellar biosynthesis component FlhA